MCGTSNSLTVLNCGAAAGAAVAPFAASARTLPPFPPRKYCMNIGSSSSSGFVWAVTIVPACTPEQVMTGFLYNLMPSSPWSHYHSYNGEIFAHQPSCTTAVLKRSSPAVLTQVWNPFIMSLLSSASPTTRVPVLSGGCEHRKAQMYM